MERKRHDDDQRPLEAELEHGRDQQDRPDDWRRVQSSPKHFGVERIDLGHVLV